MAAGRGGVGRFVGVVGAALCWMSARARCHGSSMVVVVVVVVVVIVVVVTVEATC